MSSRGAIPAHVLREQELLLESCRVEAGTPTTLEESQSLISSLVSLGSERSTTQLPARVVEEQRQILAQIERQNNRSVASSDNQHRYPIPGTYTRSRSVVSASEFRTRSQLFHTPSPARSASNEVDVDNLRVERRPPSTVKSGRISYNHNNSVSTFDDFRVGAFEVVGAGEPPTHPMDQQSQRPIPRQVLRRMPSESDQSTITRTVFSADGNRQSFQQALSEIVTEEPSALFLPATLVVTNPTMMPPPNSDSQHEPDPQRPRPQPPPTEQKTTLNYVMGGTGFVFIIGISLLLVFTYAFDVGLPFYQRNNADTALPSNDNPETQLPTRPIPTLPPTQILLPDLPQYTKDAIRQDPQSPQALAYQWIIDDVQQHPNRSTGRMYQRFALATLYFATGGTARNTSSWKIHNGWLNHSLDECKWVTSLDESNLQAPDRIYDPNTCLFERLDLSNNDLVGFIPPELSLMTNLRFVNLKKNDLKKPPSNNCLPTQLGLLTQLEHLDLYFSYVCGTIPSQFGMLTSMTSLQLERNNIIGTIPKEVGMMTNILELNLADNKITGDLPNELSELIMQDLQVLNLRGNRISGTIPSVFNEALVTRREHYGSGNDESFLTVWLDGPEQMLTGTIPEEMCLNHRIVFDCNRDGDPDTGLCGCWCACEVAMNDPDAGLF